jgi:putative ABC transport system permease protein
MQNFIQNVKYGLRTSFQNLRFTIAALLTLAIGIGANTAIFTLINAALLEPLPYHDSSRLVVMWETNLTKPSMSQMETSAPTFADWKNQNQVFEDVAAFTWSKPLRLSGEAEARRVFGVKTTHNILTLLGARLLHGRGFIPSEGKSGNDRVAILGYALWQEEFGGRQAIIGQNITLNGDPYTVVGILPPEFEFPLLRTVNVVLPLAQDLPVLDKRGLRQLVGIGRLKTNVTLVQARADMDTIAKRLAVAYPKEQGRWGVNLIPLRDNIIGPLKSKLMVFMGAVGLVLLIACTNVANLLLARTAARQREFAIRAAIGAKRGALVQQLLVESLLLASTGGLLGIFLGYAGLRAFVSVAPTFVSRVNEARVDLSVLAFTLVLSLGTTLIFGLWPALRASNPKLNETLKAGLPGAGIASHRHQMSGALVISEVALSLVLLIAAGLLIKNFVRLLDVDLGFNADNLVTMRVALSGAKYTQKANLIAFYEQLQNQVRTLPRVEEVDFTSNLPMGTIWTNSYFGTGSRPLPDSSQQPMAATAVVTTDYFRTMQIPLLEGRYFNAEDTENSRRVVIINQAIAQRFLGGEDPIGKQLTIGSPAYDHPSNIQSGTAEIIGVVQNVRTWSSGPVLNQVYGAYRQAPSGVLFLVVHTRPGTDLTGTIAAIRREVAALDKDQLVYDVKVMKERISDAFAERRVDMFPLTVFGALALILTALGIYGVISYSVAQRTHEIGIRMALGARRKDVLGLIVRQAMLLVGVGLGLGLIGALCTTRLLSNMVVNLSVTDPMIFASVILLLSLVALAAAYLPARQATRVDPIIVLRYQ